MSGKKTRYPVVLLSLLVVTAAKATPTVRNCSEDFAIRAVSARSDAYTRVAPEPTQITERGDSHLAAVAAEYLNPPTCSTDAPVRPGDAKFLPPLPGALFMVLTGFLCVSLVKDRRFWLAALTGLLWVGQAGVQALPRLALRRSPHNHRGQVSCHVAYRHCLENPDRPRSDMEVTQYIGPLHHLAGIPKRRSALQVTRPGAASGVTLRGDSCAKGHDLAQKDVQPSLSAIIPKHYCLIWPLERLASRAEQFACFSPAFILDNLSRGPPRLA